MRSLRSTLTVLGTTALMGGLATPALAQDSAGTYPTDTDTSQSTTSGKHKSKQKGKRGKASRAKLTDAQLTTVAEALGTTLAALKTAQSEVKAAVKASEARETRSQRDAMLAEKLGVTSAELRAAFDEARPARGGSGERRGGKRGGCKRGSDSESGSSDSTDTSAGSYPTDGSAT